MPSRVTALQRPCGWLRLWLGTLHSPHGRGPSGRHRAQSQPGPHLEWKRLQVDSPAPPLLRRDLSHSYCEAWKETNVTTNERGVRPAWGPPRDTCLQGPPRIP